MSRLGYGAALLLLTLTAACEQSPEPLVPESDDPSDAVQAVVGDGVLRAVRAGENPRLVIAFDEVAARTLAERRSGIAAMQAEVLGDVGDADVRVAHRFQAVPAMAASVRSEGALRRLAAHPGVRRIDLDVGGTGTLGTSVPWIGAHQRHAAGNDGEGVVVAVLDSGLDTDHPDLSDDVGPQACFGDNGGSINGVGFCPNGSDRQTGPGAAEDDAGHGSHVSGIITSRGTVSARGVAPGAQIVGIKVLNNCSFAGCFFFFSEIVAALDYIINNNNTLGVDVINMSLGTSAQFSGACDNAAAFTMAGASAINTLRSMGVLAFASSGNNGSGTTMPAPACLSNVVSVGATDNTDAVAAFTQSNSTTDIFAPGVNIQSLSRFGGTVTASGTSMASPHAAGCAALLIEAGDATTPDAIETRLETSTFQVTDATNGLTFPRIDCRPDVQPIFAAVMDLSPGTISKSKTTIVNAILLSSAAFDATAVTLANVRMLVKGTTEVLPATRNGAVTSSTRDWDGDGRMDRLVSFRTADLVAAGFASGADLVLQDLISAARWQASDPSGPTIVP